MIENHTLLIPTFNRPALLKRLVSFYKKESARPNILVLDSSRPEVVTENEAMLKAQGDSVRHVAFASDTPMAVKLHHGLAQVRTPYVSFCADDDVVFPEGLRKAIDFLEGHPGHASAHGRYLNFQVRGQTVDVWIEYAGPGNEAEHPGARIFHLFQGYESLFYGLFRAPDLRDIFAGVSKLPTLHYQELFQSVAALIKGKVRRFNDFYAARQSGDPAEPTRQKWQTFYWVAENPGEVLEHYRSYCAELWKFYQGHGPSPRLDREAFYKVLDLSHAVYFAKQCPPAYFHSVLQAYWPNDRYFNDDPNVLSRTKSALLLGYPRLALSVRRALWGLQFIVGARQRPIRTLNRKVQKISRNKWYLRLPVKYRSLGAQADFRRTYLELCRYLDES